MSSLKELYKDKIQAHFEDLFQDIVLEQVKCTKWQGADIVFRNGKKSDNFEDVEFLMANDSNGASLLYSSQNQGTSVYSVISENSRVTFTRR